MNTFVLVYLIDRENPLNASTDILYTDGNFTVCRKAHAYDDVVCIQTHYKSSHYEHNFVMGFIFYTYDMSYMLTMHMNLLDMYNTDTQWQVLTSSPEMESIDLHYRGYYRKARVADVLREDYPVLFATYNKAFLNKRMLVELGKISRAVLRCTLDCLKYTKDRRGCSCDWKLLATELMCIQNQ